jgi:SRSO17 transposase
MEEAGLRVELEDYVGQMFASLGRKDQRAKGRLYLQGLMLEGRRKSMQPMAERLAVDHQQLQQFVTSSPWKVEPVRRRLPTVADEAIAPEALPASPRRPLLYVARTRRDGESRATLP